MTNIRIDMEKFLGSVDMLIKAVDNATKLTVRDGASLIERNAKQNFAGQVPIGVPRPDDNPKPYAHSEDLKKSIGRFPETPRKIGPASYLQTVAPTTKYGRRIELGFTGTDSLGRSYNQRAYPYLQPAVKKVTPMMNALFIRSWNAATH